MISSNSSGNKQGAAGNEEQFRAAWKRERVPRQMQENAVLGQSGGGGKEGSLQ